MSFKKVKILSTIGPSSNNLPILRKMLLHGMNAVRINSSHGDFSQYSLIISNIRKLNSHLPIVFDTEGRDVRIDVKNSIQVKKNDLIEIGFSKKFNAFFTVNVYSKLFKGSEVLFTDGLLKTRVIEKKKQSVIVKALSTGEIKNHKGANFPGINLGLPLFSKKDFKSIKFALKKKIEFLSLSFTESRKDLIQARKIIGKKIGLIAKIENSTGLKNFNEILEEADAIMIARGDLGVEVPAFKLPLIQKQLIKKCNQKGKPVIVATEMLESMIEKPRATRAETSDIANAVLDGCDAIMLSGESAVGKYPVESVQTMNLIALETQKKIQSNVDSSKCENISDGITKAVFDLSEKLGIQKIIALTKSGYTAKMISRFRANKEIIAVTDSLKVRNQLELVFGVKPVLFSSIPGKEIIQVTKFLFKKKMLTEEEEIIFVAGFKSQTEQKSNVIQVNKVKDLI